MPTHIDRDAVGELVTQGAQLVEVLPSQEFEEEHLPGAVSIPLKEIRRAREELDPARPVIVYCYDYQ